VVTATNAAFEERFDPVARGTPVGAVFDRFETVTTSGDADPVAHLTRGESVTVSLADPERPDRYVARVVPGEADAGHLVFTDLAGLDTRSGRDADSGGVDLGEATRVVSHDLRNPLDVARANLTAARETGEAEYFDAVERAHDRMTRIIRDVLTLARGEAAVDPARAVPLDEAAADAWDTVDTERGRLRLRDGLPAPTADPDRVRRLFENCFRNSLDHGTTADEPGVTVTVGPFADGFYVADDGPGVPSDEREAVFDPGYTSTDRGAGLGLPIVARIAEAHGWTVTLGDSEAGGARVEVSF